MRYVRAGRAAFTGRGLSRRDTSSRPGPARGPCPTESRPHSPGGGCRPGFQLALMSPRTTAEGASPPLSGGENRDEERLPPGGKWLARPDSGPGALPTQTRTESGAAAGGGAAEAQRAALPPAAAETQRRHPGGVPVAVRGRHPSPARAFLPGCQEGPVVPRGSDLGCEEAFLQSQDRTRGPSLVLTSCPRRG